MEFQALTGGCKCGRVRFRIEVAPIMTHCCHCRSCQKRSGSAFGHNTMIESEHLTPTQGAVERYEGEDGQAVARCPSCCVALWSYHPHFGDAIAIVGVGVLDQGERLRPEAHYFTRSKHPWVALPPDVPSFLEMGYPDKPDAVARIEAVLAGASEARSSGA